jgi:hypothetical protein
MVSKTHTDTCYLNFFIAWLFYVSKVYAYNSHDIHFRIVWTLFCENNWQITKWWKIWVWKCIRVKDWIIASYNMVHQNVRDNGYEFTIIHVNHMIKDIYFYVWVLCDRCWLDRFVHKNINNKITTHNRTNPCSIRL